MEKVLFKFRNTTNTLASHLKNVLTTDKLRPAMQHVFIDLENEKMVATDAHILVTYDLEIFDKEDGAKSVLVMPQIFDRPKYMVLVDKKSINAIEYHVTQNYVKAYLGQELLYQQRVAAENLKFPKWNALFENLGDTSTVDCIGINLTLIKKLKSAIPVVSECKFTFTGKSKAIIVEPIGVEKSKIKALIMPVMLGNS